MRGQVTAMRSLARRDFLLLLGGFLLSSRTSGIAKLGTPVEPLFFENWADDNHCPQATIMMVLNTLDHAVSWNEINAATEYQDGLYSWSVDGAAAIAKYVGGVKFYSDLDYDRFAVEGQDFLKSFWSPEWFALQQKHASPGFVREQKAAKEYISHNHFEKKWPSSDELFGALEDYLIIPLSDVEELYPGSDDSAHFILLYANDGNAVWIHDPGLPPHRSLRLPKQRVYSAYAGDLILVPHGGRKFGPSI